MSNLKTKDKILIVANWKMNPKDAVSAARLGDDIERGLHEVKNVEVVLCPPFPYIPLLKFLRDNFQLGAQDCFWEDKGAFTGEVSPAMLKELGCSHVILGHSERAKYLGETEDMVQKKVRAALKAGLKVVLCVGEHEQTPKDMPNLMVVYEPEWAISSEGGGAADTKIVAARVAHMRKKLKTTPILYGGSVDSSNIAAFLKETGVQGALVGSASLNAKEFVALVKNAAS